ncbi:hypothetical protein ACOMHN_044050 [Nucella lapillus]
MCSSGRSGRRVSAVFSVEEANITPSSLYLSGPVDLYQGSNEWRRPSVDQCQRSELVQQILEANKDADGPLDFVCRVTDILSTTGVWREGEGGGDDSATLRHFGCSCGDDHNGCEIPGRLPPAETGAGVSVGGGLLPRPQTGGHAVEESAAPPIRQHGCLLR